MRSSAQGDCEAADRRGLLRQFEVSDSDTLAGRALAKRRFGAAGGCAAVASIGADWPWDARSGLRPMVGARHRLAPALVGRGAYCTDAAKARTRWRALLGTEPVSTLLLTLARSERPKHAVHCGRQSQHAVETAAPLERHQHAVPIGAAPERSEHVVGWP